MDLLSEAGKAVEQMLNKEKPRTYNMEKKQDAYEKIIRTIEGCKNQLHIQTCTTMIGMFMMKFDDAAMELNLKFYLDERMNEIGLVTL